jgi:hypothetical protein
MTQLAPFLDKPPIDRLRALDAERDALRDYLAEQTRPWGSVAVPLDGAVMAGLWVLLIANTAMSMWLIAVLHDIAPCSGTVCSVATWGHPGALLVCAGICLALLGAAAISTRGLSEARVVPTVALVLGGVCGVAAVSGVIVLLIALLLAFLATVTVVATVVERL